MQPTLLVLAAGMGSRYGGLKQIDPMGPHGETVLDYSVHDAIAAGFGKVVFIIRQDFADAFKQGIGARFQGRIAVDYAYQKLDDLPGNFSIPQEREKPWGTSHAVWAARHLVDGPFAVINADDFYGADAYRQMADFLKQQPAQDGLDHYCMVGYQINKTLSEHGTVNRGICSDDKGLLVDVEEYTDISRDANGSILGTALCGNQKAISEEAIASMNFWGFFPSFFSQIEDHLVTFLSQHGQKPKSECYIPTIVDELIREKKADCRILPTTSRWFGVTYPDDKPAVVEMITHLISEGEYPSPLV